MGFMNQRKYLGGTPFLLGSENRVKGNLNPTIDHLLPVPHFCGTCAPLLDNVSSQLGITSSCNDLRFDTFDHREERKLQLVHGNVPQNSGNVGYN
jgi:hypothetical protein